MWLCENETFLLVFKQSIMSARSVRTFLCTKSIKYASLLLRTRLRLNGAIFRTEGQR